MANTFPLFYGMLEHDGSDIDDRAAIKKIQGKVAAFQDGRYGIVTTTKVKDWQLKNGLSTTGNVYASTWEKMFDEVVVPPPPPPPPSLPQGQLVFSAPFSDTTQWTAGKTSSFPGSTPQINPGDNKLDRISPSWSRPDTDGTFRANRNGSYWDADLVTTEYSSGNFKLKTGDTLTATVTLKEQQGAWPAIWTWGSGDSGGHGEVDLFEYHPDNPRLLELSNHVIDSGAYVDNKITPGVPFNLKVEFKSDGVRWYVDGVQVYKGSGLPPSWWAYIIVNLSVCAGKYHPAPSSSQTNMDFKVTDLKVWR